MKIHVDDNTGKRLDVFLSSQLPEQSRARIQSLLKSGDILVNGEKAKAKSSIQVGDTISVNIPEPKSDTAEPENIPIDVSFTSQKKYINDILLSKRDTICGLFINKILVFKSCITNVNFLYPTQLSF